MRQALFEASCSALSNQCRVPAAWHCGSGGLDAYTPACSVQAAGPTCCRLRLPQPLAVLHKVLHIPQTLHICCQVGQVQLGPGRGSSCLQPRGGTADQQAVKSASSGCCLHSNKCPRAVEQPAHQCCMGWAACCLAATPATGCLIRLHAVPVGWRALPTSAPPPDVCLGPALASLAGPQPTSCCRRLGVRLRGASSKPGRSGRCCAGAYLRSTRSKKQCRSHSTWSRAVLPGGEPGR